MRSFLVAIVCGVWLVAACGSGATEGVDDDSSGAAADETDNAVDSDETGGGSEGVDEEEEYSWGLPGGDPSSDPFGSSMIAALRVSCEGGQDKLDEIWSESQSPQTVLLFQAAVYVCDGDQDSGAQMLADAEDRYGREGLGSGGGDASCMAYTAIISVLEQVAHDAVDCPGGEAPEWRDFDNKCDPRFSEDECDTESTESTEPVEETDESTDESTEEASPPSLGTNDG